MIDDRPPPSAGVCPGAGELLLSSPQGGRNQCDVPLLGPHVALLVPPCCSVPSGPVQSSPESRPRRDGRSVEAPRRGGREGRSVVARSYHERTVTVARLAASSGQRVPSRGRIHAHSQQISGEHIVQPQSPRHVSNGSSPAATVTGQSLTPSSSIRTASCRDVSSSQQAA
jgi:hypothetical protein